MRSSIKTSMNRQYASKSKSDPIKFIESLSNWMIDDLQLIREEFVDLFPPDWKIEEQLFKAYHKCLYEFLKNLVMSGGESGLKADGTPNTGMPGGLGAASLLAMSQFAKEYKKTMVKDFLVPADWLKPALFDGKEQDLVEDYMKVVIGKMSEWTDNLMKNEIAEFTKRESEPQKGPDNKYILQGHIIFFEMLNSQINLALDSNQGAILTRVVEQANTVMKMRIHAVWLKTLDFEYKRQIEAKAKGGGAEDEVPPGLVEYTMALANDQVNSADLADGVSKKLEPLVSETYQKRIAEAVDDAMDGYLEVAKRCVQVLIDVLLSDIKKGMGELFTNKWYTEKPIEHVVATLDDYLKDFKEQLDESLFPLLLDDLIDTFLLNYIAHLRKASKLRMPGSIEMIKSDVKLLIGGFTKYRKSSELREDFKPIEAIIGLLSSSKSLFALDYYTVSPINETLLPDLHSPHYL
jgi:exocyst complex component 3